MKYVLVTAQVGGAQYSCNVKHENLPVEYGLFYNLCLHI